MKVEMLLPPEFTKAKSIIGEYDECEWLYTNKLDKLNKMEKFLETHKLQKPTQEEMEYLKRIISNKQNQSIIKKKLLTKKIQGQMILLMKSMKILKKK